MRPTEVEAMIRLFDKTTDRLVEAARRLKARPHLGPSSNPKPLPHTPLPIKREPLTVVFIVKHE